MDDALRFLREFGFPAAVAVFVLLRLEARLRELTHAVTALRVCIARLTPGERTTPPPDRGA